MSGNNQDHWYGARTKCLWPRYHACLEALKTDKFHGLAITITFEKDAVEAIELTRNVFDVRSFALEVIKHGSVHTAHKLGIQFVNSTRKLTNTLIEIPDDEIKDNFAKFLKVLEKEIKDKDVKKLDSKDIIKDFLRKPELYTGVELTLHSVSVAAIEISVESVVESLVSCYESHFDSKRQLT